MKKLLSLLNVLTITGTSLPTTIAASNYERNVNTEIKSNKLSNGALAQNVKPIKIIGDKTTLNPIKLSTSIKFLPMKYETKNILAGNYVPPNYTKKNIPEQYNTFENYFYSLLTDYFLNKEDLKKQSDKNNEKIFLDYFINDIDLESNILGFNYSQKNITFNCLKNDKIDKTVKKVIKSSFIAKDDEEWALTPNFTYQNLMSTSVTTGFKISNNFKVNLSFGSNETNIEFHKDTTDMFTNSEIINFPSQKTRVPANSKKEINYIIYDIKEIMKGYFSLTLDTNQEVWIFSNKFKNKFNTFPLKINLLNLIIQMKDLINEKRENSNWNYSFDFLDDKKIILNISTNLEVTTNELEVNFENSVPLN